MHAGHVYENWVPYEVTVSAPDLHDSISYTLVHLCENITCEIAQSILESELNKIGILQSDMQVTNLKRHVQVALWQNCRQNQTHGFVTLSSLMSIIEFSCEAGK